MSGLYHVKAHDETFWVKESQTIAALLGLAWVFGLRRLPAKMTQSLHSFSPRPRDSLAI